MPMRMVTAAAAVADEKAHPCTGARLCRDRRHGRRLRRQQHAGHRRLQGRLLTGEPSMKKLILSLMLAFAVIGGTVVVSTVATNPAYADGDDNGGGGRG